MNKEALREHRRSEGEMTNFTDEQINEIKAAFNRCLEKNSKVFPADLISELTKPKWEPEAGEVVSTPSGYIFFPSKPRDGLKYRPLTTKEAGAQGLVDALKNLLKRYNEHDQILKNITQTALDEWFKYRDE